MKKGVVLLMLFNLLSCNNNKIETPKKPDNLIAKDKMVAILYDMAIINAAKSSSVKVLEKNYVVPENYIFTKHNIDSLQFEKSNNYYTYTPEIYKEIYNTVQAQLNIKRKRYKAILDAEKKERDSINKIRNKEKDSISKLSKKKRDSIKKLPKYFNLERPIKLKKINDPSKKEEQLKQ